MPDQTITSVSRENRKFRPSAEFKAQANLGSDAAYKRLYAESVNSPEKFWARQAKEHLVWRKPFKKALKWDPPHAQWFTGGKLNVAENCLDRHLGTPVAEQPVSGKFGPVTVALNNSNAAVGLVATPVVLLPDGAPVYSVFTPLTVGTTNVSIAAQPAGWTTPSSGVQIPVPVI